MNKYTLTNNTKQHGDKTLYQIKALRSFGNVKEGELGGYIEKESNLSQEDLCWVYGDAQVFENAQVYGYALVCGDALVYGKAQVYGAALVYWDLGEELNLTHHPLTASENIPVPKTNKTKKEPLVLNKKKPLEEKPKMFTYTKLSCNYSEEHQPNPLQWCLLEKTKENTYKNISNWFVCKDFFNDLVVAIHNKMFFTKYGFSVEDKPIPKKDTCLYVALNKTTKAFLNNLKALPLPHKLSTKEVDGVVILRIPAYYHKNTYRISLLTLLIRLCNVKNEIDVLKTTPTNEKDKSLWEQIHPKLFDALPDPMTYTWFNNTANNSKVCKSADYTTISLIHNNGIVAWKNSGLLQ